MKDVEIHFPNSQIRLDKVEDETAEAWQNNLLFNRTFVVEHTAPYMAFKPKAVRYIVNGELVTYMIVKEHQEGF